MMLPAAPGDVLAVSAGPWLIREVIELGERMRGLACPVDHVIVVTHQDAMGRWIGVQGQPGGVGLVDCTPYLRARVTQTNHGQPKPPAGSPEMTAFLASCAKSLGIRYDWLGIGEDALDALHLHDLTPVIDPIWRWPAKGGLLPGHLVCSSLAAELYKLAGWPRPDVSDERQCEPADWYWWNRSRQWETAAA
jgi:hypothetical protein